MPSLCIQLIKGEFTHKDLYISDFCVSVAKTTIEIDNCRHSSRQKI